MGQSHLTVTGQFGSPDAFVCHGNCTIDSRYVDGVSITHGASPRKHIWTYAAGVYEIKEKHSFVHAVVEHLLLLL